MKTGLDNILAGSRLFGPRCTRTHIRSTMSFVSATPCIGMMRFTPGF